jgi:hypothetical protein
MARRRTESDQVEELNAEGGGQEGTEDVIEFSEEAQAVEAGEAAVQEAGDDPGRLVPDADLLQARDELEERLGGLEVMGAAFRAAVTSEAMGLENIVGIGVGMKESNGTYTGDVAVKVYVREKVPLSKVESDAEIPEEVAGYPTDVEAVGEILPQVYNRRFPRPVPCGVSCGHVRVKWGTLGCLVVLNNNRLAILSSNHVLANDNNARPGDSIIQPGRIDGGQDPGDRIGVLERFVPIQFSGPNQVDCAAAWTSFSLVKSQHVTYRMNPTPLTPSLSLSVMKNGRTTQATQGVITGVAVNNVRVAFGGGVAVFNDQIIIRPIGGGSFSQGGDSGSVVVSVGTRQPVGLLFAGSATHTIANPIGSVISELGIRRFIGG